MKAELAGLQYLGESGITQKCKNAVVNLIHCGEKIYDVKILTFEGHFSSFHALLLTLGFDTQVVIKDGFASGYDGAGPKGYSFVLNLLNQYTDNINEYIISDMIFKRISTSSLTVKDLEYINSIDRVSPAKWYDFVPLNNKNKCNIFSEFPLVIPMSILDPRLIEIALDFEVNPDNGIMKGFRKLEDIVRKRTGLSNESSTKLLAKAFQSENSILYWENLDSGESIGRASLFTSVFMAYRNRRAHQELNIDLKNDIREFMLLNQLFILESEAILR